MTHIELYYKAIVKKMLPDKMKALPDDIIFYVIQPYLNMVDMRKTFIYNKYYFRASNLNLVFTPKQVFKHFPQQLPRLNGFTIDEASFQSLKQIIVCMKTIGAIQRMRSRRYTCARRYIISSPDS